MDNMLLTAIAGQRSLRNALQNINKLQKELQKDPSGVQRHHWGPAAAARAGLSLRIRMIILVGQDDETARASKPGIRRVDFFELRLPG